MSLYESVIDLVGGGEARLLFSPLQYTLATEDSERIGLDHVARISGVGSAAAAEGGGDGAEADAPSKAAEHMAVQHSAIKMLAARVRVILDYVRAVEKGEVGHNHEILREAKALADR